LEAFIQTANSNIEDSKKYQKMLKLRKMVGKAPECTESEMKAELGRRK
jgi:hypothetical protein